MTKIYGEYILDKELSAGKLLSVWRAYHAQKGDSFILKIAAPNEAKSLASLKHEYSLLSKIHLPHVIKPIEKIELADQYGIVFEDLRLPSLDSLLEGNKVLALANFFPLAIAIAEGLKELHSTGIIHKDIKPSNILIDPEMGLAIIMDLSIATELSREHQSIEAPEYLEGTLPYMSPEQTGRMNCYIDHRTDLYSLGITFYRMLTGRLPFIASDPLGFIYAHMTSIAPPVHTLNPEVPEKISEIIAHLMAKEINKRYQNVYTLEKDLRCCWEAWQKGVPLNPIMIKQHDIPALLTLPAKLYGREETLAQLQNAYEQVANGKVQVLMVTGDPGVGKTAVIDELQYQLSKNKCYFIQGKFDQFRRDQILAALAAGLNELMVQLMTLPEVVYEEWRHSIKQALGPNAKLITNLVPNLSKMLGAVPEVIELSPDKAFNRLMFTLQDLLSVLATEAHPLVIFLDDLQWADVVTLKWLAEVIKPGIVQVNHLLIIGAYRQQAIDSNCLLSSTLKEIRDANSLTELHLAPLAESAVRAWLRDTLYAAEENSQPLADLFYQKTHGNPFYLKTLLITLHREGLIYFNHQQGDWNWELAKIAKQHITDNVIEFLLAQLQQLPGETQYLLRIAACMGSDFSLENLALIAKRPIHETATLLWPALTKNIIEPLSMNYRLVMMQIEQKHQLDWGVRYRFAHDRVQQSAYLLLSETQRIQTHYQIGKLLWEQKGLDEQTPELIIEILNQYISGLKAVTDPEEKMRVAQLCAQGANLAIVSANFSEGEHYSQIGLRLLPTNSWADYYELTFNLNKFITDSAYANGNYELAKLHLDQLLSYVKTSLERLPLLCRLLEIDMAQSKFEIAMETCVKGLACCGITFPSSAIPGSQLWNILKSAWQFFWRFRRIDVASLIDQRPTSAKPEILWATKFFKLGGAAFYETGHGLLLLPVLLQTLVAAEKYGMISSTILLCLANATLYSYSLKNYHRAKQWVELCLKLIERYPDNTTYPACMENYVRFQTWIHPGYSFSHVKQLGKTIREVSHQIGDKVTLLCSLRLEIPASLKEAKALYESHHLLISEALHVPGLHLRVLENYAKTMNELGETKQADSFNLPDFSEQQCIQRWQNEKAFLLLHILYVDKILCLARERHYAQTYSCFDSWIHLGKYFSVHKSFVQSEGPNRAFDISLCACHLHFTAHQQRQVSRYLRKHLGWLKPLARYNPTQFLPLLQFLNAHFARMKKRYQVSIFYLEQAIAGFQANYKADSIDVLSLALAFEYAGEFYFSQQHIPTASFYLQNAYGLYQQHDYLRRVQLLEERYPALLKFSSGSSREITNSTIDHTSTSTHTELNFATLLKATATISESIDLTKLLKNLLRIILENSGAERGALIVNLNRQWLVKACGSVEDIRLLDQVSIAQIEEIPLPISRKVIELVIRHQKPIILKNACEDSLYANDVHIQKEQIKSIICLPLIKQQTMNGVLYLENQQVSNAFTENHQHTLNTLSVSAAISLENAVLYENTIHLNKAYERFMPKEFLNLLQKESITDIHLGDHIEREMTVLFVDIRSFTSRTEAMNPDESFKFVNNYLSQMEPLISKHNGFIDKYIGDAIMALFPTQAEEAVKCAIEMLQQLEKLNVEYKSNPIRIGIGINTGKMTLGIVGGKMRLEGTVISDAVNVASRIEKLNKLFASDCLISSDTLNRLPEQHDFHMRRLGRIAVRGKSKMTEIYEIFDHQPSDLSQQKIALQEDFAKAIEKFEEGDFNSAQGWFKALLEKMPQDTTLKAYLYLCEHQRNDIN